VLSLELGSLANDAELFTGDSIFCKSCKVKEEETFNSKEQQ